MEVDNIPCQAYGIPAGMGKVVRRGLACEVVWVINKDSLPVVAHSRAAARERVRQEIADTVAREVVAVNSKYGLEVVRQWQTDTAAKENPA